MRKDDLRTATIVAGNCGWSIITAKRAGRMIIITLATEIFGVCTEKTVTVPREAVSKTSFPVGFLVSELLRHERTWQPFFAMAARGHGAIDARKAGFLTGRA